MNETALSSKEKTVFLLLITSAGIIYLDLLPLQEVVLAAVVVALLIPAIGTGRPLLFPHKRPEAKATHKEMPLLGQQYREHQAALKESYRRTFRGDQQRTVQEVQQRERKKVTKINPDYYSPEVALSRFTPSSKTVAIGVGCAGINAVNHMMDSSLSGIDTIAIDSDLQKLHSSKADCSIFIGDQKDSVNALIQDSLDQLLVAYQQATTLIVLVGLGGKTGTVIAPVIAREAKRRGVVVHLFAIEPFEVEGKAKREASSSVLTELREELDTVLSLSNEDLMSLFTEDHRMIDSFSSVSEIWKGVAVAATSRGVAVQ